MTSSYKEPLSADFLRKHYIDMKENRYQISELTGVDPVKIGSLLQKYNIKRYTVKRHGLSRHPLNVLWCGMKERCNNPNADNYKWYGALGISVCDEWASFENFYNWAIDNGWERGLTLDRIDGCKNYSPDNCRFITMKEQCKNRKNNVSITVDGVTHLQCEWEEILGFNGSRIAKWKKRHDMDYVIDRIRMELQKNAH